MTADSSSTPGYCREYDRRRQRGVHSVLLVRPAADWRPNRWHSIPTAFESVETYARKVTLPNANSIASTFNQHAIRDYRGEWMLVVHNLRGWRNDGARTYWQQAGESPEGGAV